MYHPNTIPISPYLTARNLGVQLCGLGLSQDTRAAVSRVCRKLSAKNSCGTISSSFSPYVVGRAPSMSELRRMLDDPESELYKVCSRRELTACRAFIRVREAVGMPVRAHNSSLHRRQRPPLHAFGAMKSAVPTPTFSPRF